MDGRPERIKKFAFTILCVYNRLRVDGASISPFNLIEHFPNYWMSFKSFENLKSQELWPFFVIIVLKSSAKRPFHEQEILLTTTRRLSGHICPVSRFGLAHGGSIYTHSLLEKLLVDISVLIRTKVVSKGMGKTMTYGTFENEKDDTIITNNNWR